MDRYGRTIGILFALFVLLVTAVPANAASGDTVWMREFGTKQHDKATDVATEPTGVYVVGTNDVLPCEPIDVGTLECNKRAFVRKYDTGGNLLWARPFNLGGASGNAETGSMANAVAADATGVYVVGAAWKLDVETCVYSANGLAGGYDAFIRKYSPQGSLLWTRQIGTQVTLDQNGCPLGASDAATGIAVDGTGVYLAGYTQGSLSGYANAGGSDTFVRRYTKDGNLVWNRQAGTSQDDQITDADVDPYGVLAVGHTLGTWPGKIKAGNRDTFVRKYSRWGSVIWTQQFGTAGYDHARSVASAGDTFYLAGLSDSRSWIGKYRANGTFLWTRQLGTSYVYPQGIDADASGVYITGGILVASSSDFPDAFLTKFSSAGSRLWTRQFGKRYPEGGVDTGLGVALSPANDLQTATSGAYVAGEWGTEDYRFGNAFLRKFRE